MVEKKKGGKQVSPKELEQMKALLKEGKTFKEIGKVVGRSTGTVRKHLSGDAPAPTPGSRDEIDNDVVIGGPLSMGEILIALEDLGDQVALLRRGVLQSLL